MSRLKEYEDLLKETNSELDRIKTKTSFSLGKNVGKIMQESYAENLIELLECVETLGYNQAFYKHKIEQLESKGVITAEDIEVGDYLEVFDGELYTPYIITKLDHNTKEFLFSHVIPEKPLNTAINFYQEFIESLDKGVNLSGVVRNHKKGS